MNTVELLLGLDTETINKVPEADVEIPRLSKLTKKKFVVTVKALSGRTFQRIRDLATNKGKQNDFDLNLLTLVYGITSPDLNNTELQQHFGAATPKDLAEKLFNVGEINKIGTKIVELSGIGESSEEEIKN